MKRITCLAIAVVVLSALLASPVSAAPRCPRFKPVEPRESTSQQTKEALKAPVQKIKGSATKKNPLVLEYEHGPAASLWNPIVEDTNFFNFQLVADDALVYIRAEWATPSIDEIDLYVYDSSGAWVDGSQAFNQPVLEELNPVFGEEGGHGFEYVDGLALTRCDAFILESYAFWTAGLDVTLKVWVEDL